MAKHMRTTTWRQGNRTFETPAFDDDMVWLDRRDFARMMRDLGWRQQRDLIQRNHDAIMAELYPTEGARA